ncbi:MAG: PD-(D/E)XK nuclease family protein [Opitutus sp.]|nr:PD-(D/E)XK nuclease family protein [Opitutus sp.]
MPPSDRFRRHFLPWDRPWLPQVSAWLAHGWTGAEPLDLSDVLAIVPTRQAGRRLREALAEHAAARGAAVFPPRVQTPDTLLALGADGAGVASRLEAILAWTDVLRAVDPAEVPDLFPVAPPRPDFAWAARLAESFCRLQTQLAEGRLGMADVAVRAGEGFSETERWRQLAVLEERQVERLALAGRREPHEARRAFAENPPLPAGVTRVVVLALPDPLPLAVAVLERWAETIPVDVAVFAPAAEADVFDAVGRPLPAAWERRPLVLPDFERRVHLCADPAAEAQRAAAVAKRYAPEPDGLVAFGVADAEVLPLLEHEFSRAGVAHYNPEGRGRHGERLHALLSAVAAFGREASFDAIAALARCPDFLRCLQARFGRGFSVATYLAELDDARTRHLPADLAALRAFVDPRRTHLARALGVLDDLRAALAASGFSEGAVDALGVIFAGREFDLSRPEDAREAEAAEAWREVMRTAAAAAIRFPDLSPAEWWELALRLFGETRRTEEKPAGALELQGWLELPWEDAPHLVVAGLNDGIVPDAVVGDAFLPETLREKLGLKSNAARFARDSYLLQALAASRAGPGGRLDLLFAKTSAAGDPLRPSRLLLRCADEELPARVGFLFRAAEAAQPNLPWTRAWRLTPRSEPPPARVPVTGLRTWLACPFRFYLQHGLKMEAVDAVKSELDARDFGTLCHTALEAMARAPALRDCVDEKILRDFLLAEFDLAARARLGADLTLPLVIQLESARQRLGRAAAVQARERAAGWVIDRVESTFSLDVGGLEVCGKIDRIDRHESGGAWRVLDYKTSDTAVPPHKSHLRPWRAGDEALPAWMRVAWNGREYVWADLQLPVYWRALAAELGEGAAVSCGYVNLPKAAGETDLALWPELGPELLDSSRACTDGVAAAIRAGQFWPPAELPADRDAFAALFHHGAAESVLWERGATVLAPAGEVQSGAKSP